MPQPEVPRHPVNNRMRFVPEVGGWGSQAQVRHAKHEMALLVQVLFHLDAAATTISALCRSLQAIRLSPVPLAHGLKQVMQTNDLRVQ